MPHKCHGNGQVGIATLERTETIRRFIVCNNRTLSQFQNCPTRSHAVWEMVMNELDRRDDPSFDEELSGCSMVDQVKLVF